MDFAALFQGVVDPLCQGHPTDLDGGIAKIVVTLDHPFRFEIAVGGIGNAANVFILVTPIRLNQAL